MPRSLTWHSQAFMIWPSQPFLPCCPGFITGALQPPQQMVGWLYPLSPEVSVSFRTLIFSCSANSYQMIISQGVGFRHGKRKFFPRKHCDDSICYSDNEFSARAFHHFLSDGEQFVMLQCLQTLSWTPASPRSLCGFNQYANIYLKVRTNYSCFHLFRKKKFLGHTLIHDPERVWLAPVTDSLWDMTAGQSKDLSQTPFPDLRLALLLWCYS